MDATVRARRARMVQSTEPDATSCAPMVESPKTMKATRHGANLIQLTKWPDAFPMNCYLVLEEDGVTLVDSTISSPADDVAALLKQLGKKLRRVALTHAHGDHVGGVAGVRQRFPGVEVSISERDAGILAGDKTLLPTEPQTQVKGYF